ncbi:unnamed protein product [Anisakis simplex]|uniref:Secreted protein n=1 Tax=Anisakis simplex TaxID=6269 RepID=A0A0M3K1C6_ANISI|nr:unnamed protein product [Anisakis simplex]
MLLVSVMYSPWIVAVILTDLCHGKALTSNGILCICFRNITEESIMDETVFSNPLSFDYNFDDDVRKPADIYDVYDELVPHLPGFVLHKNGKDIGYARVPIVTRRLSTWSTPPPRHRKYENYDAWTPAYYRTSRPKPQVRPLSSKSRSTDPKALHQKANRSVFHHRLLVLLRIELNEKLFDDFVNLNITLSSACLATRRNIR